MRPLPAEQTSSEAELKNLLRDAGASGTRAVKVALESIGPTSGTRPFTILASRQGARVQDEFQRCVRDEGTAWLLLVWLPQAASEVQKATYARSVATLSRLVPQPYFLREHWAGHQSELLWPLPQKEVSSLQGSLSTLRVAGPPQGPISPSANLTALLQRLVQQEDWCLRLSLHSQKHGPPSLEGKVMDCRSPSQLSKAALPAATGFFALYYRQNLVFVHWMPEHLASGSGRTFEDVRNAVLKASVLEIVLAAFPKPPQALEVFAREPEDILDGFSRLAASIGAPASPSSRLQARDEPKRFLASTVSDWPHQWPKDATPAALPSSLVLPKRPVPPWRGGSKSHSIISPAPQTSSTRSGLR